MAAAEAPLFYEGVARTSAAFRLLKQMGWEEGEGLGKDKQGITKHLRVSKKKDNGGIGVDAQAKAASNWTFNTRTFDNILKNLNVIVAADTSQDGNKQKEKTANDSTHERVSHPKKATRPQGRYKKKELGKVLEGKSQGDLEAILGYGLTKQEEIWPRNKVSMGIDSVVPSERLAENAVDLPPVPEEVAVPNDWWGTKHGFVPAGSLGQESVRKTSKGEVEGVEATRSREVRTSFCEQDQEDLYKLVHDKATKGWQGLGIADRPKKIGGAHWKGQKVVLDVSEEDDAEDGDEVMGVPDDGTDVLGEGDMCKREASCEMEDGPKTKKARQEMKFKWKKVCRKFLQEAPDQTMKVRHLHKLVVEEFNEFSCFSLDGFKEKLNKSSKFTIEGKKVSPAALGQCL